MARGPVVVSLFSGAGGLSRGFADAGLRPALAAEIDEDAVATYRANVSEAAVRADIGTDAERVVREAERRGAASGVMAVVGGPPCQGFSTAGSRDRSDPRNRLVSSYLDVVARLRPSWFLFENVEGILTSGGGDAVVGLAERLADLGYSFRIEKVNFAAWGVPQARKRVLVVGNRHGARFELPEPTHAFDGKKHRSTKDQAGPSVSLGDAIAGLPPVPAASHRDPVAYASDVPVSDYDARMRTAPPGPKGHACADTAKDAERIRLLRPGQSLRDLPPELWPESFRSRAFRRVADGVPTERRGGAPAGLRRLDASHASLTITSFSPRELVHPSLGRTLSLRECARLQGFPDGYDFHGGFQSVATQVGNAVPPLAARVLAEWLQRTDGAAGGDAGATGTTARPGLLGYHLTGASAMSPALAETDRRLRALLDDGRTTMPAPRRPKAKQPLLFGEEYMELGPEDRKLVTSSRDLGSVGSMSDRELARLVSVVLRDLGRPDLVPEWARDVPAGDYYDVPLAWFTKDEERPFGFNRFFLVCRDAVQNFRVIYRCITNLHRRRRRYAAILRVQPLPTMEQVGRRGLLEYGTLPVDVLASWLTWRKWVFDADARSAQETGLLFEPILAESLGGRTFKSNNSPVRRAEDPTKGRQVDCVVDVGTEKLAYEFKVRFTIAASGQGRFAEELSFPRDCRASGYTPVLLVMDPTPNEKLDAITAAFREAGGAAFLGNDVWKHVGKVSGTEVATFVRRYVKDPEEKIAACERELLDFGMRYRSGPQGDTIEVTIGRHTWAIPRPPRDQAVPVDGDEGAGGALSPDDG